MNIPAVLIAVNHLSHMIEGLESIFSMKEK